MNQYKIFAAIVISGTFFLAESAYSQVPAAPYGYPQIPNAPTYYQQAPSAPAYPQAQAMPSPYPQIPITTQRPNNYQNYNYSTNQQQPESLGTAQRRQLLQENQSYQRRDREIPAREYPRQNQGRRVYDNSPYSPSSSTSHYFGVDGIWSHVHHTYYDRANNNYAYNNNRVAADNFGFGFNLGIRQNLGGPFVALEGFYDQLNSRAKSPSNSSDLHEKVKQDSTKITNRYGAKVNLGVAFNDKIEGFVTGGVANVRYKYNSHYAQNNGYEKPFPARTEMWVPIYGVGLNYNINSELTARIAYERQAMKTKYIIEGERITSEIVTVRSGLAYKF